MVLCQSPEGVQQEVMSIVILHCPGFLRVIACSKIDAGVEAGGSLLTAHPFLLARNTYTDHLYSLRLAMYFV